MTLPFLSRAIHRSSFALSHLLSPSAHRRDQQATICRCLVTLSIPPPTDTAIERPETLVLVESSLYKQKWENSFAKYYPERGIHFGSLDIASTDNCNVEDITLESMEQTLSNDISALSESAYTILIARGPLQSLVAQYYLESLPLAGLVLIDPLILPDNGRSGVHAGRWKDSVHTLLTLLNNTTTPERSIFKKLQSDGSDLSLSSELNLLGSLPQIAPRPLYLEPSSVPILILHSRCDKHQNFYEQCARISANFHGVDENSLFFIPANNNSSADNVSWVIERVYDWYEDCVA